MIQVGTFTLSEQDYDHRDYLADNVLKNFDKLETPKEIMWWISETYSQWKLWSCTAMATTHSAKSQNEKEYNRKVFLNWQDLRAKAGHSLTEYDWGDSVERIVKLALKQGIQWEIDGKPMVFKSDAWFFGKRDSRKKALLFTPLIVVWNWDSTTWSEMSKGEVKTIKRGTKWHATLDCGFDGKRVYFYNSRNKKPISSFKISIENFEKAIACGMINWRWFGLVDKNELNEFAKEIELSKQIITSAQKLYDIADDELQTYFEKIGLSKFLQDHYKF